MNKTFRYVQSYLILGLPLVIALMVWNTIYTQEEIFSHNSIIQKILFNALVVNIFAWFITLIAFLITLVACPSAREKTLMRLANLKERDEREEYITGKASRATYLSMISVMILFLFFSLFSVDLRKTPKEANGQHNLSISLGVHFTLLDSPTINKTPDVLFESRDIPLSKSAIILFFICWQLAVFNITARRIKDEI